MRDLGVRTGGNILVELTRLLVQSARLRAYGHEEILEHKRQGRRVVFVGWHGHDFVNLGVYHPLFGAHSRGAIMVRGNAGGLVLKQFGRRMGIDVVPLGRTPHSPETARGVVTMTRLIRGGHDGLLAVDGPEGPPYVVKPGAALIAQRARAILAPTAVAASRAVRLRSRWDEHLIPLPGARIVVHFGPLIDAGPPGGPQLTVEELSERIGKTLTEGVRTAERLLGQGARHG
jgi:lysophospholipid acyltransferase (LPLAT)-like uncharacterized protein